MRKKKHTVYFITYNDKEIIKIGSTDSIRLRLKQLQVGNPFTLWVEHSIPCETRSEAFKIEHSLHRKYKEQRMRPKGEFFSDGNRILQEVRDGKE